MNEIGEMSQKLCPAKNPNNFCESDARVQNYARNYSQYLCLNHYFNHIFGQHPNFSKIGKNDKMSQKLCPQTKK